MVTITKEAGIPDWGGRLYQRVQAAFNSLPSVTTPILTANLPTPTVALAGQSRFVSDATATTFASIVAGSGSNAVPVYCDGAAWRIG